MGYFLNSGKGADESLLLHRNIVRKSEKRFCEVLRIWCTFPLNKQLFIIFGLNLGPDFGIFSEFREKGFMNQLFSIVISWEKAKNVFVRFFSDPMQLFIKDSICPNFWPKFGTGFWDIFSISGNELMNHFFGIVISYEKAKNGSARFCGSDAPFH